MKKIPVYRALLAVILTLTYFGPSLRADETKPPDMLYTGAIPMKPPAKLINIDFPGGSVAQFVAAVAKSDSEPFNIIGEKEEMEVQLPPFSFRNAELVGLANAISVLLRQRGLIFGATSHDLHTYTLSKDDSFHRLPVINPVAQSAFESFLLKPYLTVHSIDDIVAAIRAGWELDPAHDRNALRIKFHPPTSVLLVSGPLDAIMLTKDILSQIKPSAEKAPTSPSANDTPATEPENK